MKVKANKATAWLTAAGASAASMAFAFPVSAFAAEDKTGIAVILPDPIEFIPMLIAFLILAIVLGKFGWPKFEGMLEKREKTIADALEQSEKARQESERVLEEYKQQLADAKSQAAQIIAEAKQTGENTRARGAIEAEKNAALAELQGSIADISTQVCARLIGEDLTTDEHRKVIERYVNEAGSFHAE